RAPDGGSGEAVGGVVTGQAHHREGCRGATARVPHIQPNGRPSGRPCEGYRKADFADAWQRYLTPEAEKAEGGLNSDILPFRRSSPCNDYTFAKKSAVLGEGSEREKNGHFSSEIKAVNGRTGELAPWGPFSRFPRADDGLAQNSNEKPETRA